MTNELTTIEKTDNVEITKREDGRTQIVFKKAILKGKVSSADVLNTILIAARMQAEKYIDKLSRGAPLDTSEVKALKELAEITKLEVPVIDKHQTIEASADIQSVKTTLYQALTARLAGIDEKK